MYTETTYSTQYVADILKGAVEGSKINPSKRRETVAVIGQFEGCGWHPMILQEAIKDHANEQFHMTETDIVVTGKGLALAQAVMDTLNAYREMHGC